MIITKVIKDKKEEERGIIGELNLLTVPEAFFRAELGRAPRS
jgi:hypothetical protein